VADRRSGFRVQPVSEEGLQRKGFKGYWHVRMNLCRATPRDNDIIFVIGVSSCHATSRDTISLFVSTDLLKRGELLWLSVSVIKNLRI
jgi:hypothetical protein